jgi:colicin import membrane protein
MASTAPHLEFAPPHTKGSLRALGLAILAHGVLLAVLTVGVQWNSDPVTQRFEAELWSSVPLEAAAPAPLPQPVPEPTPVPAPKPVTKPEPAPPPPDEAAQKAEAQIALAKEKQKEKDKEKDRQKAKALKEKQLALDKQALEEKKQAELDKQKDQLKKEQAEKQARAKEEQRKQDLKDAQALAEQRQKAIKRMEGLAGVGGNGAANSTSTSLEAKALSNSYQGRIRAYIKRFHTYTETVAGNPVTEIEIRTASDGSILSRKVTKPSGTKSWDEAALNAIDKAERLPLDENGRSPSPMTIIWSAQEIAR